MAPVSYGPLDSDVVMVTTRRRVEDFGEDFDPISASKRAARISAYNNEDLETMKSRSRGRDQALLSDINTKLGYGDFADPVRVRRGSSAGLRRIVIVPTSSPTFRQYRQSTPPPARVVTVNAGSRGRRATSVPPMPTQTRVFEDEDFVFPRFRPSVPHRRTTPKSYQHSTAFYSTPPPPSYAHKARTRAGSEPPPHYASDSAVRNARRCLHRLETELGTGGYGEDTAFTPVVLPARRHVYRAASVPRGVPRSVPLPVPHVSVHHHVTPRVVPSIRRGSISVARHYAPPPSPVRSSSPSRGYRVLMDMHEPYTPSRPVGLPTSFTALRHQTVEARNKLDHTRTLYDRYLPCPTGYPDDVQAEVDFKYSELAARIPALERKTRAERASGLGHVAPYVPVGKPSGPTIPSYMTGELRHPPPRPKVSEARKHAREVLCRTHRDPNYYNY